jgi:AcrR family transcriptional regulator
LNKLLHDEGFAMTKSSTATDRRADILAATIRVLARDGLAATTTRKIATEAGVNQATLRYYFGSKDDLLFAVLQAMMQNTGEIVQKAVQPGEQPAALIRQSLTAFWSHVESSPELQVMQYELTLYALRNPASAWLAKEQYDGYCTLVENLFQYYFEQASVISATPLPTLARFTVAGIDGLILQFVSDHNSERARRDLNTLIQAVLALTGIS